MDQNLEWKVFQICAGIIPRSYIQHNIPSAFQCPGFRGARSTSINIWISFSVHYACKTISES